MVKEKENNSFPLINGHVLLIDDEAVVREIGSEMLESLGISCIVADDGEKGIQIYKEKKDEVALVILDIEMPGISGDKVYDILKEINPKLKILIISGYAKSYLEAKYFKRKLGGTTFMPKPFQLDQLTHKLKTLMKM
jgi:two-component system cell cycle sensor histidine kinase/response regulator CckA